LLVFQLIFVSFASAQDQCGVVTSIGFPVDRSAFQIAQDFGVPSPRYQGRYHTGEDLYGGRGTSYGQPVHAIAAGRVTYSAPNGWGRDGGVVIIEHTFPDGSVAYSMYGHMQETDTVKFPARYTCVQGGDVVGTVGDIRPAPHLHFEIRVNQPDVPGPGYTYDYPTVLGWRQPDSFVLNWQTWLLPAHRWHTELTDPLLGAPLVLSDGSMMVLTTTRLRGLTPDGRILWRVNLDKPPAALTWLQGFPLLMNADGTMQLLNFDGTTSQRWTTGIALDGAPISAGDLLLFHTPDNVLAAFTADRREIAWRLENVPPYVRAFAAPNMIGLVTDSSSILSVSPDGKLLDTAQLSEPAGLSSAPDGNLLVYGTGGLWEVDASGTWSLVMDDTPAGGENSAALIEESGARYILGGSPSTLRAVNPDNSAQWQIDLPDVHGRAELTLHDKVLLLTTDYGFVVAVQAATGAICGRTRLYGDARTTLWHTLGDDGILRLAIGSEVVGLDWKTFIGGCA
jgi:murein DD-endopeptidase MepM/ murein hydrolase activator NlpD